MSPPARSDPLPAFPRQPGVAQHALPHGTALGRAFFDRSVHEVAPNLIGATLLIDGVGGIIVEVEAYHHTDPAAHSFRGQTERNKVMFGPPGHIYVYRSYGLHWCMNFVSEAEGSASAVLLRALEPTTGLDVMRARRGDVPDRRLCAGPGNVCAALGVTESYNGRAVDHPSVTLLPRLSAPEIAVGIRVGITKAADYPWRYGLRGSRFLSKPIPPEG